MSRKTCTQMSTKNFKTCTTKSSGLTCIIAVYFHLQYTAPHNIHKYMCNYCMYIILQVLYYQHFDKAISVIKLIHNNVPKGHSTTGSLF